MPLLTLIVTSLCTIEAASRDHVNMEFKKRHLAIAVQASGALYGILMTVGGPAVAVERAKGVPPLDSRDLLLLDTFICCNPAFRWVGFWDLPEAPGCTLLGGCALGRSQAAQCPAWLGFWGHSVQVGLVLGQRLGAQCSGGFGLGAAPGCIMFRWVWFWGSAWVHSI